MNKIEDKNFSLDLNQKEIDYLKLSFTKLHASDWTFWAIAVPMIFMALVGVISAVMNPTAMNVVAALLFAIIVMVAIVHPRHGLYPQHQLDKSIHRKIHKIEE